jgi:branched-chain amino acid transport system substrate-binding protein
MRKGGDGIEPDINGEGSLLLKSQFFSGGIPMAKKSIFIFGIIISLIAIGMMGPVPEACAENIIKIGHMNPLTGPAAPWGVPIARGFDCLAEYYNEQGGIKADGKTWKIKMLHEDNKYRGEIGRAAAEKLISKDKVKAILGDFCGDALLGYRTLAHRNKVIVFMGSSAAEKKLLGPKWPYMFQVSQTQEQKFLSLDIAMDTLKKRGAKLERAASIDPDSSTGRGCAEAFTKEKAPQYGMKVVGAVLYPRGTKDFYPFCTKLMNGKPDIVEMGGAGPGDQALIRKTMYELGYKGYSVASGSLVNVKGLIKIAGKEAIQGHIAPYESFECPIIKPEQREIMKIIQEKWKKKWPDDVFEPIAWRYATLLQILVEAYKKAGTLDPDVIVKTLEQGEFETILGDCRFTGKKTFGIAHCANLITIAGIVDGDQVKYLGYARLTHE